MNYSPRTLALLALLWLTGISNAEERSPARQLLAEAVTAEEERQVAIVRELSSSDEPIVETALVAWRRGEIYLIEDQGIIVPAMSDNADSKDPVPVRRLADNTVIKDSRGAIREHAPSDLTSAKTTSSLRRQMKITLDLLALAHPDPARRADGAIKLGLMQKEAYWLALRKRLEIEPHPEAIDKIEEAIAISALTLGTPSEILAAATVLGEKRSIPGVDSLKAVLEKQQELSPDNQDLELITAVRNSLATIERYLVRIDRFGTMFRGLSLGSVLLIVSLGLAITFGLMGVINMAHGELIAIGGYSAYLIEKWAVAAYGTSALQWYFILAIPFSFLAAAVAGLGLERGVIRFLYKRPLESLLATWGVSMILEQVFRLVFGAANVQVNSPDWLSGSVVVSDLSLGYNRIFVIGFAAAIVLGTWILMTRTSFGLCIRAVMQNRDMASCMGIRASRIRMGTFAFGSGLAGLAGCFLSQIGNVGPTMGQNYIVDSFMVVVAGGVGNLMGTVCAALGIGMTDQMLQPILGPVIGKVCVLVAIILFLQWRPGGLFAARTRNLD